jgi:actin-related protein
MRCGVAGDDAPLGTFPTLTDGHRANDPLHHYEVGDVALSKRSIFKLKYPIEHGVVTDW